MNNEFLETIRCEDGKVFHLRYHQLRYEDVLRSLGCNEYKDLRTLIKPPEKGLYRCRLVYTIEDIEIEYIAYKKRDVKTLKLVFDDTIEYSKKYADREKINELFERRDGADDILIIKNNRVTDTSIANVAFFNGKEWITPINPLLKGTTQVRLLEEGKIIAKEIFVDELSSFTGLALLNAMIDFDIIAQENIRDTYC